MKTYRNNSGGDNSAVPVLIPCTPQKMQGLASFKPGLGGLIPVRVLDDRALTLFVNAGYEFEKEYGRVSAGQNSLLHGLLDLTEAVNTSDPRPLQWACQRLATDPNPELRKLDIRQIKSKPHQMLAEKMTEGATRVKFVLWYRRGRKKKFLPGLFCPDVLTALYAHALLRVVGGRGLAVCEICGKALIRSRGTRKTCSGKCRQKKHRSKKRKGKNRESKGRRER